MAADDQKPLPVILAYETGVLPEHGVWLKLQVLRRDLSGSRTAEVHLALSKDDARRLGADLLSTSGVTHLADLDPSGHKPS